MALFEDFVTLQTFHKNLEGAEEAYMCLLV